MKELIGYLIGKSSPAMFLAMMLFALIGAIIMWTIDVRKRDKMSESTPVKFSLKFWFMDNYPRIIGGLLLVYISIRFMFQLIPAEWLAAFPDEAELIISVAIGLSHDKLGDFILRKLGITEQNREKVMEKLSE